MGLFAAGGRGGGVQSIGVRQRRLARPDRRGRGQYDHEVGHQRTARGGQPFHPQQHLRRPGHAEQPRRGAAPGPQAPAAPVEQLRRHAERALHPEPLVLFRPLRGIPAARALSRHRHLPDGGAAGGGFLPDAERQRATGVDLRPALHAAVRRHFRARRLSRQPAAGAAHDGGGDQRPALRADAQHRHQRDHQRQQLRRLAQYRPVRLRLVLFQVRLPVEQPAPHLRQPHAEPRLREPHRQRHSGGQPRQAGAGPEQPRALRRHSGSRVDAVAADGDERPGFLGPLLLEALADFQRQLRRFHAGLQGTQRLEHRAALPEFHLRQLHQHRRQRGPHVPAERHLLAGGGLLPHGGPSFPEVGHARRPGPFQPHADGRPGRPVRVHHRLHAARSATGG